MCLILRQYWDSRCQRHIRQLTAPDHSTVSRRAMNLELISKRYALPAGPAHILIASTELKVFGAGKWL